MAQHLFQRSMILCKARCGRFIDVVGDESVRAVEGGKALLSRNVKEVLRNLRRTTGDGVHTQ